MELPDTKTPQHPMVSSYSIKRINQLRKDGCSWRDVANFYNVQHPAPLRWYNRKLKRRKKIQIKTYEIIHGNCLDIIPLLPIKFDLIFVDPPYPNVDQGYGKFSWEWYSICKSALNITGTMLMTVNQQHIIPLFNQIPETPKSVWIFDKRAMQRKSCGVKKGKPRYLTEWVLDWHWNNERYIDYNFLPTDVIKWGKGGTIRDTVDWHSTPKPLEFMTKIIRGLCPLNGWILDPFCGSGTTLVAAKRARRKAIGIEINKNWVFKAQKRVNNTIQLGDLSRYW